MWFLGGAFGYLLFSGLCLLMVFLCFSGREWASYFSRGSGAPASSVFKDFVLGDVNEDLCSRIPSPRLASDDLRL